MKGAFQSGDKVRFKDEYDGYFMLFKDQDLTIYEFYPKDGSADFDLVKIKEIVESGELFHLISVRHIYAI